MVRDVPGQEHEAALEWGIDFNLEEGEELPADVEELTEAQYTIFQFMKVLEGTFKDAEIKVIMGDQGSGLVLPEG